jgi:hypothetical protein
MTTQQPTSRAALLRMCFWICKARLILDLNQLVLEIRLEILTRVDVEKVDGVLIQDTSFRIPRIFLICTMKPRWQIYGGRTRIDLAMSNWRTLARSNAPNFDINISLPLMIRSSYLVWNRG